MDRLDAAIKLYKRKRGSKILVTAERLGTSTRPLNEMALEYLTKRGVLPKDIIRDTTAKHTYDEVKVSKEIVDTLSPKKLHVITSAEHAPRMAVLISRLHPVAVDFTMVHHRSREFKKHSALTEPDKLHYFRRNGITIDGKKYDAPNNCDELAKAVKFQNYREIKRLIPKLFTMPITVHSFTATRRRSTRPKIY